ncbi:MAG TPA: TetR/AcrR family transcriptional regulator [Mycobacterium sp.]|nr:TetR/AcrR family transcriptional regulator [Mycobacterium sp.]
MASPRERMVKSAAVLIRERGGHPTAIADVLEHSRSPRGSAYHYFPGGRTQLLCEAVDYAGRHLSSLIEGAASSVEAIDAFIGDYRQQLLSTGFRAGCPVAAVVVEAGNPDDAINVTPTIEHAAAVFDQWTALIAQYLTADGVPSARSRDLALFVTASVEGAIVLARAYRNIEPLDLVHARLSEMVGTVLCEATVKD